MSDLIKIGCMNVRGLGDDKKRHDVFSWLKRKNYSIYCLQDIHIDSHNAVKFCLDWGSEIIYSSYSSMS